MMHYLIIGAGPAGLGAAQVLAHHGAKVTVVDRQSQAGGIPRLCGHSPFGMREFHRVLSGKIYARRLTTAATDAGAEILLGHAVTSIDADLAVQLATSNGLVTLNPDRILLTTGAREASRAERLLPGERPLGIITTGALQDLWFAHGILPFRRPVILGSELVAMSAILTCRQAGARPLAIIEPSSQAIARAPFRWLPKMLGIPLLTNTSIEDIIATGGRLSQLRLRNTTGQTTEIKCDGLVLTGSFRPESGLARMCGVAIDPATQGPIVDQTGRTSRPEIFAAGNLLRGIETAGQCWAEGRAVALSMIADLTPVSPLHITSGKGLRYVMPQKLQPGQPAALALQFRLDRPAHGTLTITDTNNRCILTQQIASGPERRIAVDIARLDLRQVEGPLRAAIKES